MPSRLRVSPDHATTLGSGHIPGLTVEARQGAGLSRLIGWGVMSIVPAAAGLVLGVMDIEVGHLAVSQGTETTVEVAFATAVLAAVGTRMARRRVPLARLSREAPEIRARKPVR